MRREDLRRLHLPLGIHRRQLGHLGPEVGRLPHVDARPRSHLQADVVGFRFDVTANTSGSDRSDRFVTFV